MTTSRLLAPVLALMLAACDSGSGNSASDRSAGDTLTATSDSFPQGQKPATATGKTAPAQIRGIYLNAYAAGSTKRLATLLAMADSTEINAFVIDVKDEKGMRYHSELPLQKEIGGEITISNLKTLVDSVHAHGVWAMARIVAFKDHILAEKKPEWSIKQESGALWRDKQGKTWVSTWDPNVWEYNIQIAEEVLKAGFDEVQFDYVRFPEPFPSLPKQVHPQAKGDRTDAIVQFLNLAKPRIHALGGVMAADLFGLSPNDPKDVQIGQQWERILVVSDHVLPMTYPSHYLPTHLKGVPKPNQMPYETIVQSVGMGVVRMQRLREAGAPHVARVIPWLQGFSAPWVTRDYPYGAEQAAAQIKGVYDVGLEDWVFWHPGSKYELISGAFAKTTTANARKYVPDAAMTAQVDLLEKMGSKAERDKAVAK